MADKPPILLVDDEEAIRSALADAFTDKGYTVISESSGNGALALLKKRVADYTMPNVYCVISDWMMTNGNGIELLANIRKDKDLKPLPFVLMSGNVSKDELVGAAKYGPDAVILKPFSADVLEKKMQEAVTLREKKVLEAILKM